MEETKPKEEPRDPRRIKRIKKEKLEFLQTLVNLFFTERSQLKDPEGEEADKIFVHYREMWHNECTKFNARKNRPFDLRGETFTEEVERILKIEKETSAKKKEEKEDKDFMHWLRREHLWYKHPFRLFWYWFISFGDHKKEIHHWKHYYITCW